MLRNDLSQNRLNTVCQKAHCPNIWECFSRKTAAFLILGPCCTRRCGFCAIDNGIPHPPDPAEPARVAEMALSMGLTHVVVTSVSRDDLPDGGAGMFTNTIRQLKSSIPEIRVEVLIPDFMGNTESLRAVLDAGPDVLNHNLETAGHLYPVIRPHASYDRSLALLEQAAALGDGILIKSGLMLGVGEKDDDIMAVLKDLRSVNCTLLTLGQYLQPSGSRLPVDRFIPPEAFDRWRYDALALGFHAVSSGPFVRSSYHAEEMIRQLN